MKPYLSVTTWSIPSADTVENLSILERCLNNCQNVAMFKTKSPNNPDKYPCFHGWCEECDDAGLTVDYVYLPKDVTYTGGGTWMGKCSCGNLVAVYPRYSLPGESEDAKTDR